MASEAGRIFMALESKVGPELAKKHWEPLRDDCMRLMVEHRSPTAIAKKLAVKIHERESAG